MCISESALPVGIAVLLGVFDTDECNGKLLLLSSKQVDPQNFLGRKTDSPTTGCGLAPSGYRDD
jgi:hypothetical protein